MCLACVWHVLGVCLAVNVLMFQGDRLRNPIINGSWYLAFCDPEAMCKYSKRQYNKRQYSKRQYSKGTPGTWKAHARDVAVQQDAVQQKAVQQEAHLASTRRG